jgi:hypothetical protein
MSGKGSDIGSRGLGDTIRDLLVSGVRLHTGLALYGIGQVQKVIEAATGEQGLPGAAETLESALDGLTGFFESTMDNTKREALRSVSRVSSKAVDKVFDTLSPEALRDAGDRLMGRKREDQVSVAVSTGPEPGSASLAVDVLSAPVEP